MVLSVAAPMLFFKSPPPNGTVLTLPDTQYIVLGKRIEETN